jgi:hypothetical protein
MPVTCTISALRAWAAAGVELRTGIAFGLGYVDASPAVSPALLGTRQTNSITPYNEPSREAALWPPTVSAGGSSSGAAFF